MPARAGIGWIRRGFKAFLRHPAGFMGLFGMLLLTMVALSVPMIVVVGLAQAFGLNPILAQLGAAVMLLPLLTLGFMTATEAVMNDLRVRPGMLFSPLAPGKPRKSIVQIALVYVVLLLVACLAGNGLDGGQARDWLAHLMLPQGLDASPAAGAAGPASAAATVATGPAPLGDRGRLVLGLKMALVALGSIPLWHAPALVYWGGQRPFLALFSSIVALWRTRAAFAVYLSSWLALTFTCSFVMGELSAALPGLALPLFALWLGVQWALTAVFYVTLWFGFVDTFEIVPAPAARAADAAAADNGT